MQVFNFINNRKLNDEFNIMNYLFSNPLFILIVFFIIILQIILVTFVIMDSPFNNGQFLLLFDQLVQQLSSFSTSQHICPQKLNQGLRTLDKKPSGILQLRRGLSLRKKQSMHEQQESIQDNHIQLIEK